jgi:hypothetical protein
MQASNFDFDVVTGPSTPREERDDARAPEQSPTPPAETKPAAPRTR